MTHDTSEDGFHEIQLSGKQLVFLFMATTVVSVVIFLCGVLVGRGVRADGAADPPIAAGAVASPSDAAPAAPATDAPPSADVPTPVPDAELTYHDRLQQEKPKEELKPTPPDARPQAAPPASAPAATPVAAAAADVPTSGRPGAWVIQVQALSNRAAAGSVVKGLIAKGYPAFLQMPAKGAVAIYRVQIGRYNDRREAEQVARRLEKEEQFRPDIKR